MTEWETITTLTHQPAACLMHISALTQHAATTGLITPSGDLTKDTDQVASLHPDLAELTEYARAGTPPPVTPPWAAHIADPPHRPDGHRLGDLYQRLSAEARKSRALCQTPAWVTRLLLDIAFDHAYREHGPHVRMIDPACGTGHILIETLLRAYIRQHHGLGRAGKPALPWRIHPLERVTAALNVVHGVDIDPYAVLVARYRLLVMARALLHACGYDPSPRDLASLPLHVAAADALLAEDEPLLKRGTYHVVLANPPYITVKDRTLTKAIRARYPQVCYRKYSLAVPFHVLMHELLVPGGWCAQLTANSFMKREFGKRYIEEWLATQDLRWVIDTSGAYIPGHGTPTVILVTRNQTPTGEPVRTIRGIRGEPRKPADPASGVVWRDIARLVREREASDHLLTASQWHPIGQETGTQVEPIPVRARQPARPVQPPLFVLGGI